MVELTTAQFEAAKAQGAGRLRNPHAESARYDAGRDRVVVRLTTGMETGFAPHSAEGLENASRDDLAVLKVQAFGLGIHLPRLDADLYVPALLESLLGSKSWMAARLGSAGGKRGKTPGGIAVFGLSLLGVDVIQIVDGCSG